MDYASITPANSLSSRYRHLWPVLVVGAACLVLTVIAYVSERGREQDRALASFNEAAGYRSRLLLKRSQSISEEFYSLSVVLKFFKGDVRPEFAALTRDARFRISSLVALAWVPKVPDATPASMEALLGNTAAGPMQIFEFDDWGNPVPVLRRDSYWPVLCLSGSGGRDLLPGLDLMTNPRWRSLLQQAGQSGRLEVSDTFDYTIKGFKTRCVLLARPVSSPDAVSQPAASALEQCRGFVVGLVDVDRFAGDSSKSAERAGLECLLLDESLSPGKRFISFSEALPPTPSPTAPSESEFGSKPSHQLDFMMGPRTWKVLLRPARGQLSVPAEPGWLVLAAGIVFTSLAMALVWSRAYRAKIVEAQVRERTAALERVQLGLENSLKLHHEVEVELRRARSDLMRAQEITGLGSWRWDWESNLFQVSSQVCRLLGRSPANFNGSVDKVLACLPSEASHELLRLRQMDRNCSILPSFEWCLLRPDGTERIVRATIDFVTDHDGRARGMIGTLLDITASKQAEALLWQQREEYSILFNLVPVFIVRKDVAGRLLSVNQKAAETLGLTHTEIEGRTLAELGIPGTEAYDKDDREVIETGRPKVGIIERFQNLSGKLVWLETNKIPYRNREGRVTGVVVLARDITDQLAAQAEIKRHNQELLLLYSTAASLIRSLEVEDVLTSLEEYLRAGFGVSAGAIATRNPAANYRWNIDRAWGMDPAATEEFCRQISQEARHEHLTTPETATSGGAPGGVVRLRVPIMAQGEIFGVIAFLERRPEQSCWPRQDILRALGLAAGAALQNARLFKAVRDARGRLQALSLELVEVQEKERQHLARELHDEIGQLLTALKLAIQTGFACSNPRPAQSIVDELIKRVRQLSLDLRPAMLDDLGLVPAVLSLIEQLPPQMGSAIHFEHSGLNRRFSSRLETTAFRVVQEGLTNAVRHADATDINVRIWAEDTELTVQVEDRGRGFDPQRALESGRSRGLSGMQERVHLLGGDLIIESACGEGTRLIAELPIIQARSV